MILVKNNITLLKPTTPIGISLPEDIVEKIDTMRGDVTRSRFILRLIESSLKNSIEVNK